MVLTDLKLPRVDGQEFLAPIRRRNAQVPMVMVTAYGSMETAVEAMKAGATDFLHKPFLLDHLMRVIHKALEVRALRDENRQLKVELGRRYEFDNIIGRGQAIEVAVMPIGAAPATAFHHSLRRPERHEQLMARFALCGGIGDRPPSPVSACGVRAWRT
jgi:DNA-binding NtrC family response regulator